ncbi:hypothetical protein [Methanosarcina siciliae]|uniref:hypothetical protein n=1 Tax=Methanosarcina siciliae TaxID=38027 RepID=UPI000A94A03B|nr:hypothetical protein [Methanosarcina siciliae]
MPDPELDELLRDIADFSDEVYAHRASEGELFRKTMDVSKLYVKENAVRDCR